MRDTAQEELQPEGSRPAAPVLRVLGSVFGVLQLSLGLEMIRFALRD